jgi:hypothetical protein
MFLGYIECNTAADGKPGPVMGTPSKPVMAIRLRVSCDFRASAHGLAQAARACAIGPDSGGQLDW